MKKLLIIGSIIISLVGCNSFIPRQDLYEKAEFEDEKIVKGKNTIDIYAVGFPESYEDKLEFFEEFELASKKMLLEDKALNLLATQDLYDSLEKFKRGEFLSDEEVYVKVASDLDTFERKEIDSDIKVDVTTRGGSIQSYLNKQVYFWMRTTDKEVQFDGDKIYTELDKQRLMEEVRQSRKEFFAVLNAMRFSMVVEIDDPYADQSKGEKYWASKEIELFNPSGISRELQGIDVPLYFKGIKEEDMRILLSSRGDFNSPIIILENDKRTGYTVRDGKYVFYHGGDILRGYYKEYDLRVEIIEIELQDLVTIEEGILLEDVLRRTKVKAKGIEEVEKVKKKKSLDWGIE